MGADKIIKSGKEYRIREIDSVDEKLEPFVYVLKMVPFDGFVLEKTHDKFTLPSKMYNPDTETIERWLKAWEKSDKNLGIALGGEKGTGKTLTAQLLCNMAKMPVIMITEPFTDGHFKQFISNPLLKNCVVFIDEFEKIYDQRNEKSNESITNLLSLFDGMYDTRILFVLTTNNPELNEFLMNRPGRIKYRKYYSFLTPDDAYEIVQDRLVNKEHEDSVYNLLNSFGNCTMDILTKVIDDMNTFNQDALTCAKYMNLEALKIDYSVKLVLKNSTTQFNAFQISDLDISDPDDYIDENLYFDQDTTDSIKEEILKILSEKEPTITFDRTNLTNINSKFNLLEYVGNLHKDKKGGFTTPIKNLWTIKSGKYEGIQIEGHFVIKPKTKFGKSAKSKRVDVVYF